MTSENLSFKNTVPSWVKQAQTIYRGFELAQRNTRSELGDFPFLESLSERYKGQIFRNGCGLIRAAFFNFIPKISGGLPEIIPLSSTVGGTINAHIGELQSNTYIIPKSKYYLPRTNEIYQYRPTNVGMDTERYYDPENPNFVGLDNARAEGFFVTIYKADESSKLQYVGADEDSLGDADIDKILQVAEEALTEEDQLESLTTFRVKLEELRVLRTEMIKQATVTHGANLRRLVDEFLDVIENNTFVGERFLKKEKWTTLTRTKPHSDDEEEAEYRLSIPDRRLFVAPIKTRKFLWKSFRCVDSKHLKEAPVSDWCWYGLARRAVEYAMTYTGSPFYREVITATT